MIAVRTKTGAALQQALADGLAPVLRAISGGLGPQGRAAVYAVGQDVRRAETGTEIARRFTGSGAAEVLLKEALVAAERDLGDGSSRLAVMAGAALHAGRKSLAAGIHPAQLHRAVKALGAELDGHFATLTNPDPRVQEVLRAAGLQASAAAELERALRLAGEGGHVELTATPEPGLRLDHVEGFSADMTPLLSGELGHMDHVHVLVANDIIVDFRRLAPVIEGFARSDKSLIIAARGIEGAAKQLLERNRQAGVLRVAALTPRDAGPRAVEILKDLACATGAMLVDDETGQSLETLTPAHLGSAATFRRSGTRVTFVKPAGAPEDVAARLKDVEHDIGRHRYLALDREHAQRRHARLSGKWVELLVGPDRTDPARVDRMSRALAAVRSAQSGGTIAGAGAGLAEVAALIEPEQSADPAERAARRLVAQALRAPGRCLRRNAGLEALDGILPHEGLADPARLSRDLYDISLSLALQLLSLEAAVQPAHRTSC